MSEPYTPAVIRAMELAQHLAGADQVVETTHVFTALLQEEEGRPFTLLLDAGLELEAARSHAPTETIEFTQEFMSNSWSDRVNQVVRMAKTLAREHAGERTVSSEQLLLAVVEFDFELRQLLEQAGLNYRELKSAILKRTKAPTLKMDEELELPDLPEQKNVARILDASANRAQEAMRVLDDYCRFVLDDAWLTSQVKKLRHDFVSAISQLPTQHWLPARDTQGDVGTGISTDREKQRGSSREVALVNIKRLQESLRSLEEFGKIEHSEFAAEMEQIRYQVYTLEKHLFQNAPGKQLLQDVRLYLLVSSKLCHGSVEWTIREAVGGGVQMVQLREKELPDRDLLALARRVRQLTRELGVLFIMNDRVDLARLVDADGVHLGQEELPVKDARYLLDSNAIVGVSTHDFAQVLAAHEAGADYIGVGPTFPTNTKTFSTFAGLQFVQEVASGSSLPAFVIGGVKLANLPDVLRAGGKRVAVSSEICGSETPSALARAFRQQLDTVV